MRRMRNIIRRYRIYENHPWRIPLQEDFISYTCTIFGFNLQDGCELRARSFLPGLRHPACAGYGSHTTRLLRSLSICLNGIPNGLQAVGFSVDDLDQLVDGTLLQHRINKLSPRQADAEVLEQLFQETMIYW